MKKLIFLCILTLVLGGCGTPIDSKYLDDSWGGTQFRVITVDSCEYLFNGNWFAHKGNCKFFKQKNQKQK